MPEAIHKAHVDIRHMERLNEMTGEWGRFDSKLLGCGNDRGCLMAKEKTRKKIGQKNNRKNLGETERKNKKQQNKSKNHKDYEKQKKIQESPKPRKKK